MSNINSQGVDATSGQQRPVSPADTFLVIGNISCPDASSNSERFGAGTSAGFSCAVLGQGATATSSGTALGQGATASGSSSVAVGRGSTASQSGCVAIGVAVSATGSGNIAIGELGTTATGISGAIAIGGVASGGNSTAVGTATQATGTPSTALGTSALALHGGAIVIAATNTTSTASNQLVISGPTSDIYIGNGVTNAAPQNVVYHATGSSTNLTPGANLTIAGGLANQNADTGGSVAIQTARTGSGTSLTNAVIVNGGDGFTSIGTTTPASRLDVQGSVGFKLLSVSGAFILGDAEAYLVDTSGGNGTGTLPNATTCSGRQYDIKKNGAANSVTLNPVGGQTIDRAANLTWTTDLEAFTIRSDGANWWIF